jgi:hypothetical protein
MGFTITDLKKQLGPGLGLRKNKYIIEIPIPGIDGRTLNVLCRSAGLPERTINTTTVWHKGRKYNMRAETDYMGSYEISIVDDSNMSIRKVFDKWLKKIDNSKPRNAGILGASFEDAMDEVNGVLEVASDVKALADGGATCFFMGFLDSGNANSAAQYQTDVNIWQLDGNDNKVYGYKLQNCFPSSLGNVTLDEGEENTLSEFSVVLTFSEIMPLDDKSALDKLGGALLGDAGTDAIGGVENLF